MKTAVMIIGCIGAGKSTLITELAKNDVVVVQIDQCREEEQAYQAYQELKVWKRFEQMLAVPDLVFAECSGTGRYYQDILSRYPGRVIQIKLTCSMETIIYRIRKRMRYGYKWPPVSWSTDVYEVARRQFDYLKSFPSDYEIDTDIMNKNKVLEYLREILKGLDISLKY